MAEVLITLTIIGVVAALTIPSVITSYKDKQYNTARLKALKTFGEAGKLASINDEMNTQTNATDFVNNVLSKYLKITKVCTLDNPTDCGFPSQIKASNSSTTLNVTKANLGKWNKIGDCNRTLTKIASPVNDDKMSIIVATNDGFSAIIYYNPKCGRTNHEITGENSCRHKECWYFNVDAACMNVVYDMNGVKGPNHVGDDIGIVTTFWSGLNVISVAPGIIPYSINTTGTTTSTFTGASAVCAEKSTIKLPLGVPNVNETASLYMNSKFVSLNAYTRFWSGSSAVDIPGYAWSVGNSSGTLHLTVTRNDAVWCVRR